MKAVERLHGLPVALPERELLDCQPIKCRQHHTGERDPLSEKQAACPFPFYEPIRSKEPVFLSEKYETWVIGRHDPVLEALRDHKSFSTRSVFMPARPWPPEVQAILDTGYSQHYLLSNNDPPEHTPLRKAVEKAFTRTQTTAMAGGVTEIAEELVDEFAADGSVHIERLCIHSRRAWSPACSACRSRTSRSSKHGATTG